MSPWVVVCGFVLGASLGAMWFGSLVVVASIVLMLTEVIG